VIGVWARESDHPRLIISTIRAVWVVMISCEGRFFCPQSRKVGSEFYN